MDELDSQFAPLGIGRSCQLFSHFNPSPFLPTFLLIHKSHSSYATTIKNAKNASQLNVIQILNTFSFSHAPSLLPFIAVAACLFSKAKLIYDFLQGLNGNGLGGV
jgi:hypothetical protein